MPEWPKEAHHAELVWLPIAIADGICCIRPDVPTSTTHSRKAVQTQSLNWKRRGARARVPRPQLTCFYGAYARLSALWRPVKRAHGPLRIHEDLHNLLHMAGVERFRFDGLETMVSSNFELCH